MADFTTWISILVGLAAVVVGYLAYKSQRGKTRLEFIVVVNTPVAVINPVSASLAVTYNGKEVPAAAVAVIRLGNTGDKAIRVDDFNSDIVMHLDDVNEVVAATVTKARPPDLNPQLTIDGRNVAIAPLLINPRDMVEIQLLTSGTASAVRTDGRIENLSQISQRRALPYPPGSGPEGEMVGFDRFVWFVLTPGIGVIAAFGIAASQVAVSAKIIWLLVVAIFTLVLYPMQVRYLVDRRRMWRP